jgi:hypothetical protein
MASAVPFALAQDAPKPGPTTATGEDESAKLRLLPEVNLQDVGLPDVIGFLRDVDPSFQAVIAYDPGATRGDPKIQELRLRNVSADAVLQLLAKTYPQISVEAVRDKQGGIIWSVRVMPDNRFFDRGRGGGVGGFGGVPRTANAPTGVTVVHRLREIVDDIAAPDAKDGDRKKALDSIVSLVQAALETDAAGAGAKGGGKTDLLLKVHEGTEALIFHGSQDQANIVVQALDALQPRRASERRSVSRNRDNAAAQTRPAGAEQK